MRHHHTLWGPVVSLVLIVASVLVALPAGVRASVPDEVVNDTAARLFANDVFVDGNLAMVPDLVAADAPLYAPGMTTRGPEAVGGTVAALRDAYPGARVDVTAFDVEEGMALAWWTLHGAYETGGIPGRAIEIHGLWILSLHEGMIVQLWLGYDAADLARQVEEAAYTGMETARGGTRPAEVAVAHPGEWGPGIGPACGVTESPGLDHLCAAIILA